MSQCESTTNNRESGLVFIITKIDKVYFLVLTVFTTIAVVDRAQFFPLVALTLSSLAHTSIYILFALLLLAGIKATGAEVMVAGIFKGRENRMIILAALIGGLAPFCSCEVIPFIAGLLALGTPLAPIMAFWLSSPLIDPPSLLITAGFLGWKFAASKAIIAVTIGLMGGFTVKVLTMAGHLTKPLKSTIEVSNQEGCSLDSYNSNPCCDNREKSANHAPVWRFWKEQSRVKTFIAEFNSNGLFLLKWMLFAYSLESLMIHYLPAELIASVVGGEGIKQIILSAFVGVPAYLNSYIAPAIVAGLLEQGMSVGSGMAFIVAGAISSIPAMTAVFALVRLQVFLVYVLLGFTGAVLSGFIYNFIG
jgi:uncharacterized membrane protein YraQ (UPF0718 family)